MKPRSGHPSVLASNDLLEIVTLWPKLLSRLAPGGSGDTSGVHTAAGPRMPIDVHVVDVVSEVEHWVRFWGHVLVDETDWTPAKPKDGAFPSVPSIIRGIVSRIGHFTESPDEMVRLTFGDECAEKVQLIKDALSDRRRRPLHIPCGEHGTSDLGARIPCPGEYTIMVDPDRPGIIPDMICDEDKTHRITPEEWQRGMRRRPFDPVGAARLIAAIRDEKVGA